MTWKIPLFKILWDNNDIESVNNVISSGMSWAEGADIKEFEIRLSEYIGTKYCLVFNNGTSALHAALLAHDISKGDEVIVPSFTFISTANASVFVGARPVFADIEEKTLGLDPQDVANKITPKTKAIIPVHYGGCPCNVKELRKIADENGLLLIEDAAEAFGAEVRGQKVGTIGDSAMFSFCQNKIITTGEGGAIVTDSKELFEKMKLIRSHGRNDNSAYFNSTKNPDYVSLGYNYRMSTILAALGISQMRKIEQILQKRIACADYYSKKLKNENLNLVTPSIPHGYAHVYQLYSIRVQKRDELMRYLAEKGIMSKVYFNPVHFTHFYRNVLHYNDYLPVTERMAKEILSLPIYPGLTENELDYVIEQINNFDGEPT
ncbi:MAG: aminotransferase DegT [Candidatus Cloacimonas sp. SDB]|nr:MAG: aminotransferase DegT [Candidatus Cloacimonas sp. SDB]